MVVRGGVKVRIKERVKGETKGKVKVMDKAKVKEGGSKRCSTDHSLPGQVKVPPVLPLLALRLPSRLLVLHLLLALQTNH